MERFFKDCNFDLMPGELYHLLSCSCAIMTFFQHEGLTYNKTQVVHCHFPLGGGPQSHSAVNAAWLSEFLSQSLPISSLVFSHGAHNVILLLLRGYKHIHRMRVYPGKMSATQTQASNILISPAGMECGAGNLPPCVNDIRQDMNHISCLKTYMFLFLFSGKVPSAISRFDLRLKSFCF